MPPRFHTILAFLLTIFLSSIANAQGVSDPSLLTTAQLQTRFDQLEKMIKECRDYLDTDFLEYLDINRITSKMYQDHIKVVELTKRCLADALKEHAVLKKELFRRLSNSGGNMGGASTHVDDKDKLIDLKQLSALLQIDMNELNRRIAEYKRVLQSGKPVDS